MTALALLGTLVFAGFTFWSWEVRWQAGRIRSGELDPADPKVLRAARRLARLKRR